MRAPPDPIALADWRLRVAELYREARGGEPDHAAACLRFRAARDELFRTHAASPLALSRRAPFRGLRYYPYDPAWRVMGSLDLNVPREITALDLGDDGTLHLTRVGAVRFVGPHGPAALSLFWIQGYGGGLFLPFGDETNGSDTYGGGRYLYDTIKGASPGRSEQPLLLDFNYAYNPSCAYQDTWVCPLAPPENILPAAVRAGEQRVDESR